MNRIWYSLMCAPFMIANFVIFRIFLNGIRLPPAFFGQILGVTGACVAVASIKRWEYTGKDSYVAKIWLLLYVASAILSLRHRVFVVIAISLFWIIFLWGIFLSEDDAG